MPGNSAVFAQETFRFFRDLSRHNHKDWMDAHRDRYRACVVEPFRVLLDRLTPAVHKLDGEFDVSGRTGRNFSRINRDIRFAHDKSPYRTQMYLLFSRPTPADDDGQLYAALSAETVTAGFRMYGMRRHSRLKQIAVPRAMQNTKWLVRQARRLRPKYESYWYETVKGEWTKRHGWPTTPEEWKRLKGWIVRRKMSPSAATRASFPADVSRIFCDLFPLYRFTSEQNWKP